MGRTPVGHIPSGGDPTINVASNTTAPVDHGFQRRRLMQKSGIRVSSEYIQAMGKMATRSHTTGQKVSLIVQATRVATTTSADAATTDTIPILTARLSTEALSSRPEMSDNDSIPASRSVSYTHLTLPTKRIV